MKTVIASGLLVLASMFLNGCKKSSSARIQAGTFELSLNDCKETGKTESSLSDGTVCYKRLITESRCPSDVVCVWQGYAQCEFTMQVDGQEKEFKLATLNAANIFLKSDTIINGMKISLIDVMPYPKVNNSSTEPAKAILKIE